MSWFRVGRLGKSVFVQVWITQCITLRHRWVNSAAAFAAYTLLASTHCLLPRAFLLWLLALQTGSSPRSLPIPASADAVVINAPEGEPENEDQLPEQPGLPANVGMPWVVWNRAQKIKAKNFIAEDPIGQLVVCTVTLGLATHMLHIVEHISSDAFAELQDGKNLHGNDGCTRLDAFVGENGFEKEALRTATELLDDAGKYAALPLVCCTWAMQGLAFTLISSTAAALESYIHKILRGFPWSLFRLLGDERARADVARELLSQPVCLRDAWSERVLTRFSSVAQLCSRKFLAFLHAIAYRLKLDIIALECRHASVRRLQRNRAATHMADVADVSAEFFLQSFRRLGLVLQQQDLQEPLQNEDALERKAPKAGARRIRRAGGPARACISETLCAVHREHVGLTKKEAFRLAHAKYAAVRAAGGPEHLRLQAKGALARKLSQAGIKRPRAKARPAELAGPLKKARAVLLRSEAAPEVCERDVLHRAHIQEIERIALTAMDDLKTTCKEQTDAEAATRAELREWSALQQQKQQCPLVCDLPRLRRPPGPVARELNISLETFVPPMPEYIQAVLAATKPEMHQRDLERLWHMKHIPIKHNQCVPPVHRVHHPLGKHSDCFKAGFCICGDALRQRFVHSVMQFLKPLFKKGAALRSAMDARKCVLCLESSLTSLFFHIAYLNRKHSEYIFVGLEKVADVESPENMLILKRSVQVSCVSLCSL